MLFDASEWSAGTRRIMELAGWFPSRRNVQGVQRWAKRLAESDALQMHQAAADALAEFGGLVVGLDGPGIACRKVGFNLDPELAIGERDRLQRFGLEVGVYPLGEVGGGYLFLCMGPSGRVYLMGDDHEAIVGVTMADAIERMLTGAARG